MTVPQPAGPVWRWLLPSPLPSIRRKSNQSAEGTAPTPDAHGASGKRRHLENQIRCFSCFSNCTGPARGPEGRGGGTPGLPTRHAADQLCLKLICIFIS